MVRKEVGMENRPTKKQRELLNFIDGFIKGNGYGPSYREIMRALDYRSVSTVATHVNGLVARGWLIKKDNSARTLEVVMNKDSGGLSQEGAVVSTASQEIAKKIQALRSEDKESNADDIATLEKALDILGITSPGDGK